MTRPHRSTSAICSVVLGSWLACSACSHAPEEREPAAPPRPAQDCNSPQLEESLRSQAAVAVILVLRDSSAGDELSQRQDRVLRDLGDGFRVARRYGSMAALAGQLTSTGFSRARVHPFVRCIQLDGAGSGTPQLP